MTAVSRSLLRESILTNFDCEKPLSQSGPQSEGQVEGHFTVFVLLRTGHLDLFLSHKLFLGIFLKFECMKVKYFGTTKSNLWNFNFWENM